jgi:hypothetical protein
MPQAGLKCSFCHLTGTGGVAPSDASVYVCPDCIDLHYEILHSEAEPQIVFTSVKADD